MGHGHATKLQELKDQLADLQIELRGWQSFVERWQEEVDYAQSRLNSARSGRQLVNHTIAIVQERIAKMEGKK